MTGKKIHTPGVYVQEIGGPSAPIEGVSTSTAAFVDVFAEGPVQQPVLVQTMADFERTFGCLDAGSEASYGIRQFFANGGERAWVVRVDCPDGAPPGADQLLTGMKKLDQIAPERFNLLCLPAMAALGRREAAKVHPRVVEYVDQKRAFYLLDIPASVDTVEEVLAWTAGARNAGAIRSAVYFPRLTVADPLNGNRPRNVAASGAVAGIYARTDAAAGVWTAPAGTEASIRGADLAVSLTEQQNDEMSPWGVNALRSFPNLGIIVWGARTLAGDDAFGSEWKYVPVRRLADYIEQSLEQGLKWLVFEPNDEPLWSAIRTSVEAFLSGLYSAGAFPAATAQDAFFVKCDRTTTTAAEIERGLVNILIGIAPLRPAEFVIIKIQQLAGQTEP